MATSISSSRLVTEKVTCLIPATANVQLGLQEYKMNKSLTVTPATLGLQLWLSSVNIQIIL